MVGGVKSLLDARRGGIAEQLAELRALRGKNQDVVEHMMERIRDEKELFERGLQRYTALRTVFTQQTNELFDVIGLEALRANASRTRKAIEAVPFTRGVRGAMNDFFGSIRGDFEHAARTSAEIHDMMQAMYTRFATEQDSSASCRRRSRCSSTRRRSTASSARTTSTSTRCGTW